MINYEMKSINDSNANSINKNNSNENNLKELKLEEVYIENDNHSNENFKNNLQEILYEDETIQLTNNYLKIFKYYYPLKKEKIILLNKIKKTSIFKMSTFTGKYKFYGLSLNMSWFHLDKKRPQKEFGIKINDGSLIGIVITPDHPQKVFDLLNDLKIK